MIDLYTFRTPNGRKPAILLEELALPYTVHAVDLGRGEQFSPYFLAMNPNGKIPVIVDRETQITVFESGSILIYLAEKGGKFLPTALAERHAVLQWLMFQMGNVGPMFGQLGHFRHAAPEPIDYAIHRYDRETVRLLGILNGQLARHEFLAGDYSIADMATYPWVAIHKHLQVPIDDYPYLQRWIAAMESRPAVQAGMAVLAQ